MEARTGVVEEARRGLFSSLEAGQGKYRSIIVPSYAFAMTELRLLVFIILATTGMFLSSWKGREEKVREGKGRLHSNQRCLGFVHFVSFHSFLHSCSHLFLGIQYYYSSFVQSYGTSYAASYHTRSRLRTKDTLLKRFVWTWRTVRHNPGRKAHISDHNNNLHHIFSYGWCLLDIFQIR